MTIVWACVILCGYLVMMVVLSPIALGATIYEAFKKEQER